MKQKNKRTPDNIGKEQYDFDFQAEKNIYAYLHGIHMGKKELDALDTNVSFYYYNDWRQYVQDKYKDYDVEKLIEFSRYLNQRIRNVQPSREYWNIFIPIILSMIITNLPEMMKDIQAIELSGASFWVVIFALGIILALLAPLAWTLWTIVATIWDSSTEENMVTDYKEIVDIMIKDKLRKKKKVEKENEKKNKK